MPAEFKSQSKEMPKVVLEDGRELWGELEIDCLRECVKTEKGRRFHQRACPGLSQNPLGPKSEPTELDGVSPT